MHTYTTHIFFFSCRWPGNTLPSSKMKGAGLLPVPARTYLCIYLLICLFILQFWKSNPEPPTLSPWPGHLFLVPLLNMSYASWTIQTPDSWKSHHPFSLKACLSHLLEVHPKASNPINTQMFSKLRIPWLAHSHVASHRSSVTWKKTYIQKLENEESYSSSFFYCADSIVRTQAC